MFVESMVTLFLLFQIILAPNFSNISQDIFISLILGKFSIVQQPSIKSVAGKSATAAFFAPFIITYYFIINIIKIHTLKIECIKLNTLLLI